MKQRKRWTSHVPEEKLRPAGPAEALERAKAELAPFDKKHTPRPCICEKCAEESITRMAREFNRITHQMKGAPRPHQVPRDLYELARKTRQLTAAFKNLDDFSREWLRGENVLESLEPDMRALRDAATADDLPQPSKDAMGDGSLVQLLQNLSEYVDAMAGIFDSLRWCNFQDEVGGTSNVVTQKCGTPTQNLIMEGHIVFMIHRPGKLSKTENGSFHRFVNEVRFFATGSKRGEASNFQCIKKKLGPRGQWKYPTKKELEQAHRKWLRDNNLTRNSRLPPLKFLSWSVLSK